MAKDPIKQIQKAEKAYEKGKNRQGDRLVEQVLESDFRNRAAWELLHQQYGPNRSFPEFQRLFIQRYYPEKYHELYESQGRPSKGARRAQSKAKGGTSPIDWVIDWLIQKFRPEEEEEEPSYPDLGIEQSLDMFAVAPVAAEKPASPARFPAPTAPAPSPAVLPTAVTAPLRMPTHTEIPTAPVKPAERRNGSGAHEKIRVIVVDDIAQSCENIIKSLSFEPNIKVVGKAHSGSAGVLLARETQPDVVLMDINMPDMDGITATQMVREAVEGVQVVILTVQDDVDYMRRAMMAGARDFLTKPPMIDELVSAVTRAAEFAHQERERLKPIISQAEANAANMQGKIITVYSPKGGAGCSTLACNLAATLHNEETPVVIVDGDLHYGDVAVLFSLQPKVTSADLTARIKEADLAMIKEALTTHSSGISVLAAPRPENAEAINNEQFATLLKLLSRLYPYVIVDTSSNLSDVTIAALDTSDLVVLVTTQDIPSLGNVRKFLELAPALDLDTKRILLVMNQYDKRISITPERIQQSFHFTVSAVIPSELRVVLPSINKGLPFMLQNESHSYSVAQGILELAKAVRARLIEVSSEEAVISGNGKR